MATTYASVNDLADRLGISIDDTRMATLTQNIEDASRWIDQQTGRRFYTVTETRYYTLSPRRHNMPWSLTPPGWEAPWALESPSGGWGGQRIIIDDFVSITSVATDIDGDGVAEQAWTLNTDYWPGPKNAPAEGKPYRSINRNPVTGRYFFPVWENGIAVTGACGFSTAVPSPIRQLCLTVAMLFARPVMEMSIPGVSSYQIGTDLKLSMQPEELPENAQQILNQFRDGVFVI